MILAILNKTENAKSYLSGLVTVAGSGQSVVSREFNVLLANDPTFLADALKKDIAVSTDGFSELSDQQFVEMTRLLISFSSNPLATIPIYYSLPVNIRQSAGTNSGAVVWAMRNATGATKFLTIERISLSASFDATTPLGRSLQRYGLRRFSGATPSGGSALTPVLMSNLGLATSVVDARVLDTGLTQNSLVLENPFAVIGVPASDGSTAPFERSGIPIKLAAGEGLAIVLENNAVVGQGLTGEIVWGER